MYGLIGKMKTQSGKRDEMLAVLTEATSNMPGNRSYVVAADLGEPNTLWITEIWDSQDAHLASLALPQVRDAIGRARGMIASMERIAETMPSNS